MRLKTTKLEKISLESVPGSYYFENSKFLDLESYRQGYWAFMILQMSDNPKLVEVADCESDFKSWAKGDKRKGVYMAYGLFQFWQGYFLWTAEKAGIKDADWYNPYHQVLAAKFAFENGEESKWTCK